MIASTAQARHSDSQSERSRCIVVERGSSAFAVENGDGFDETVTIVQMEEESAAAFAQRVLNRVAKVERSGRHFGCINVLASAESNGIIRAARRLIVLGLSAHVRAHGAASEILLQSHSWASTPERNHLLELVGEVTEPPGLLSVRLCFGELFEQPTRRSGFFARASRGDS